MEFSLLPDDPLLHILSYLQFTDLTRCGLTCHRLYGLSQFESLWKRHCNVLWDATKCLDGMIWKETFATWYHDFGKYWKIYKQIRRAWDKIEAYVETHCPGIHRSLQDGVSEMELDEAEHNLDMKLPLDLRCVYRIHNGQQFVDFHHYGVFGTVMFSRYYSSESLLPLNCVVLLRRDSWSSPCIFAISCVRSSIPIFISSSDQPLAPHIPGTAVFYAFSSGLGTQDRLCLDPNDRWDLFVCGNSFLDYFVSYADKLSSGHYPVVNGEILRFHHDDDAVATTDHVRISAATAFMPMISTVDPPEFVFAYRITLSMDKNVHPRFACQLETRKWYITDDNGKVETVNGPGVVGLYQFFASTTCKGFYPVVKPGSEFSYISCTRFSTVRGTMHGIYTMRNLATSETLDAAVPKFCMKAPPCASLSRHQ